MNPTKTVNRGQLLKLAKAGRLVAVSSYSYDEMMGESRGEKEMPVRVKSDHEDFLHGFYNLTESDFKSRSGSAWENPNGTITLYVHSNKSVDLKVV